MNYREKAENLWNNLFPYFERDKIEWMITIIESALRESADEAYDRAAGMIAGWNRKTDWNNKLLTYTAYHMAEGIRALKSSEGK